MIGVVTTSYPRDATDSAGSFVATRVRELAREHPGETVLVIAAGGAVRGGRARGHEHGGEYGPEGALARESVRQVRIPSPLFEGAGAPEALEAGGAWRMALEFSWRLTAAVRAHRAQVTGFESHWLVPCGLAVALAAPGVRHRAFVHSGDVALLEALPRTLASAMARTVRDHAHEICCASEDLRRRLIALLGDDRSAPTVTTRAVAADPRFSGGASRGTAALHERDANRILAVGRLVPIKGFDVLVHALGRLPAGSRPRLLILGEGPERGRLRRLAAACRVTLALPGQVAPHDVAEAMRTATLCVVPSRRLPGGRSEGVPLVAREALGLGVPLVASAVGGLPELAGPGVRLQLVRPDDARALAETLRLQLRSVGAGRDAGCA